MIKTYTPLERGLGDWIEDSKESSFEEADIVLIPGGSDWNPDLYGHSRLPTTYVSPASDAREMGLINQAIDANKFIVGICKGSQGLTIRAGGWLIQHVTNHGGYHEIDTDDGKTFTVNSTHHQMSYPYDMPKHEYQLLGWSNSLSTTYLTQGNTEAKADGIDLKTYIIFREPEVIWYPRIRGLACQMHPEYSGAPAEFNKWLNELILTLIK